jgi:arylamine N-acetyltransferase
MAENYRQNWSSLTFKKTDIQEIKNHIKANNIKLSSPDFLMSLFNEHIAEKLTTPSGVTGTFNELLTLYRANKLTKKADMNYILNLMATKELTK